MNDIDSSARLQQYRSQSYNSFTPSVPQVSNSTMNEEDSITNSKLPLNFKSNFTRRSSLKVKTAVTKLTRPKKMDRSQSDQTTIKTSRLSLDINPIASVQGLLKRSYSTSYTPSSNTNGLNSSNVIVQDLRSRRKKDESARSNPVIVESSSPNSEEPYHSSRRSWRPVSFSGQSSSTDELHSSTLSSRLPPYNSLPSKQLPPRRKRAESIKKWITSLKSTGGASKRDSSQDFYNTRRTRSEKSLQMDKTSSFEVIGRPLMVIRSKSAPVIESVERISELPLLTQPRSIPFPSSSSISPTCKSDLPIKSNISTSRRPSIDFTKVDLSSTPRARSTSVASLLSLSRPPDSTTSNLTPSSSPSRINNLTSQTHTSNRTDVLPLLPLRARAIQIANNSISNSNTSSTSTSQDDRALIQRPSPSSLLQDSPLFHPNESSYFSSRDSKRLSPSSPSLTNATLLAAYLSDGPRLNYRRDAGSEEISLPSSSSHSHSEEELADDDDGIVVVGELASEDSIDEKEERGDLDASEEAELQKRLWRSTNLNRKSRELSEISEKYTEGIEAIVKVW